jgi:tetratricopeptide (TPR) repeat protein
VRGFPFLILAAGALVVCLQLGALYSVFWFRSRVLIDTNAPPSQALPSTLPMAATPMPRNAAEPLEKQAGHAPSTAPKPSRALEERIAALNDEALRFEAQGEYGLAQRALAEAEKLDPTNGRTLANLARLAEAENKLELADRYWKRIVELGSAAGDTYWLAEHRISQRLAQTGGAGTPLLRVGAAQRSIFEKSPQRERFAIYLPIRLCRRDRGVNPGKVNIKLYFYDRLPDGRITPTKAKLRVAFENGRPTWSQGGVEVLWATYESDRSVTGGGEFYGYLARIYYDGVLQDEEAEPPQLLVQVPYTSR